MDQLSQNDLRMYPNPSNGKIHIEVASFDKSDRIVILNELGEIVNSTRVNGTTTTIELPISSGVYTLKYESSSGEYYRRIVRIWEIVESSLN